MIRRLRAGTAAEIIFARDCTKPAKKEGDKKAKINVTFTDYDDDDYGDGVLLTCFKNKVGVCTCKCTRDMD